MLMGGRMISTAVAACLRRARRKRRRPSKHRRVELLDITVIGGGPTGLFALFYAGMRGAKAKVIDALPELGGQLYALYPEKYIYDMPGIPAITGQALVDQCVEQAFQWPHAKCLEERVIDVARQPDGNIKVVTDKAEHLSRTVILCSGIGAFKPRKLAAPTAAAFEGKGLSYYARNFDEYAGKHVVVIGGGDSAVDYALAITPNAASLSVVHRSPFRAHPHSVDQLRASPAKLYQPDFEVKEVRGDGSVSSVTIHQTKTKEEVTLRCDSILCALGFVSDLGEVKKWGIELDGNGIKVDTATQETSVKGIYAAGDVVQHPGKLKLIACGTSEAAIAVNQAMNYMDPSQKIQPVHSSNLTLPISAKVGAQP
jgi:thioredoxin reductase (NADPH)